MQDQLIYNQSKTAQAGDDPPGEGVREGEMREPGDGITGWQNVVLIVAVVVGASISAWLAFDQSGSRPMDAVSAANAPVTETARTKRSGPRSTTDEIVVGMSAPFAGPSRGLGIELYRGSAAYFEHINRKGGVHGRRISIKCYDDGYNPGPAMDNTVRLIEDDDAFLLFNYVGTPTTTRCLPLLKQKSANSVYLFFPFTGAQPQRQPPYGEFAFNLRASYYEETAGLVDRFIQIGRKRIAVFYQIDAYGRNGWEGVRTALSRHGLHMLGEASYRRGASFQTSMKPQLDLLRATGADAVISVGSYAACAAFIRDARDAGWEVPIANISFVGSENLLALLQTAAQASGTDYTRNLINSQVVPDHGDLSLPAVREYRECMSRFDPQPPAELLKDEYRPIPHCFVSFEGFLNAKLLVAILEKMGPPFERSRLRQAAETVSGIDLGIKVPFSFSPTRHQATDRVYFTTVVDGRFVNLTDWEKWRP
jgi:ABC-type branched-subunit amino acid transport system substrate-binding protein